MKFTLIRYLKTSSLDLRFKKIVELPGVPAIENAIQLKDHSVFIVRCLTFCEGGGVFILVENEFVKDNQVDDFRKQFERDGWVLSDYENND